jgi:hypothetical protein
MSSLKSEGCQMKCRPHDIVGFAERGVWQQYTKPLRRDGRRTLNHNPKIHPSIHPSSHSPFLHELEAVKDFTCAVSIVDARPAALLLTVIRCKRPEGWWDACAKSTSNAADGARDAANGYVMRQHNTTNCVLLARGDESALQLFFR